MFLSVVSRVSLASLRSQRYNAREPMATVRRSGAAGVLSLDRGPARQKLGERQDFLGGLERTPNRGPQRGHGRDRHAPAQHVDLLAAERAQAGQEIAEQGVDGVATRLA